jgi:hypothetical protein
LSLGQAKLLAGLGYGRFLPMVIKQNTANIYQSS